METPIEFLYDFLAEADRATDRIWIQAMHFTSGDVTGYIKDAVDRGIEKNLDVRLYIDAYTTRTVTGKPRLIPVLKPSQRSRMKANAEMLKRLKESLPEGSFYLMNDFNLFTRMFPIAGRNHSKIYVVDDKVWIGGVNLSDGDFFQTDVMVKLRHPSITDAIEEQFERISSGELKHNYSVDCGGGYRLLFDAGIPNDSIILDEAVQMIDQAGEGDIYYVSPFLPDGSLLNSLIQKSQQGQAVHVITSNKDHPSFQKFPYYLSTLEFRLKGNKTGNFDICYQDGYVHMKAIKTAREVLFGSSNFVRAGIMIGTQECAVRSSDHALVCQFDKYIGRMTNF